MLPCHLAVVPEFKPAVGLSPLCHSMAPTLPGSPVLVMCQPHCGTNMEPCGALKLGLACCVLVHRLLLLSGRTLHLVLSQDGTL